MEIYGKEVVDATKPLRITITKKDAMLGKSKDPGACAAARAIIRTVKNVKGARVHLGATYIEHPDKWVRYFTPNSLRAEIISFDRGAKPEYSEGSYTLYAPSKTRRLGARPKPRGPKTPKRPRRAFKIHQVGGVRAHGANR